MKGIDAAVDVSSHIDCLQKAGIKFVCRYYNTNRPSKNLTRVEAVKLLAAHMPIVTVWENGYPTTGSYFSYGKGVADAKAALKLATELGQPNTSAIFFAVDYDAAEVDVQDGIRKYFNAICDTFLLPDGTDYAYYIGVYGSGAVCRELRNAYLVDYVWLAQSSGWRGSSAFNDWNIKQHKESIICGLDVDQDEVVATAIECGGFNVLNDLVIG